MLYASPPLSGGPRERYLWPSSVALHAPDVTSHILRVMSLDPDTMVSPLGENSHAKTEPLPFFEVSGNTYVMVVYASPPVSGGGVEPTHAKLATFRTMRSPVALERVQALACR